MNAASTKGLILLTLIFWISATSCKEQERLPNVFLIYVDDLRPELGAYGNEVIQTPHLDRLAMDAMVFNKAYASVPVCGASRASMLTGMMPNRHRFVDFKSNAEQEVPSAITLPAYLKQNGYRTLSLGKVFHTLSDSESSWSQAPYRGPKQCNKDYVLQENIDIDNNNPRNRAGFYEMADTVDEAYLDGKMALKAVEELGKHPKNGAPLFMAVGFWKPHLPFNAPQKYWDLYDPQNLPFPANYFAPEGAPQASLHQFAELRSYTNIPNDSTPLDSALVMKLVHGYYAAASYVDQQIGKFIQGLKDQNLYENSIIVLVGDHGWFLGEHAMWCKHANYENALRAACMIKFPGNMKKGMTNLPVSFVEIYPTLMEMIGLEQPAHLHGSSFLEALDMDEKSHQQKAIYARYLDGETIIKGRFAYTAYYNDQGSRYAQMLYDHKEDPAENRNIVESADSKLVSQLDDALNELIKTYN